MITYEEIQNAKSPMPVLGEQRKQFFENVNECCDELIQRGALISDAYETTDLSDLINKFGVDVFYIAENFLAYSVGKYIQNNIKVNNLNSKKNG